MLKLKILKKKTKKKKKNKNKQTTKKKQNKDIHILVDPILLLKIKFVGRGGSKFGYP